MERLELLAGKKVAVSGTVGGVLIHFEGSFHISETKQTVMIFGTCGVLNMPANIAVGLKITELK